MIGRSFRTTGTRDVLALLALLFCLSEAALADVLVPYGAEWLYRLGTEEASAPADAWRKVGFATQNWSSGVGPIGYGEPDIVTSIPSSGEGNWLSVFLRKTFVVSNPASVSDLELTIRIDDGYVVWINGTEVGRYNVPDGELPFNSQALSANEPVSTTISLSTDVGRLLVPGVNVLAVQAFNGNSGSSDLLLDAQLTSTIDQSVPREVDVIPPGGAAVRELSQIEIYFNESVRGVDAADLLVNGSPAAAVAAISPRQYIFTFTQPPPGTIQVAWALNHGITDLATPANPLSGGSWTYQLNPNLPRPTIILSELMADNTAGLKDDDGNRSDWIELLNLSPEAVNLEGWFLTDDATKLTKWRFPKWVLSPNGYLLVWASEKNRINPSAPLHTNFKLSAEGEYLALVDERTNIVSEFAPIYPRQQQNVSFGRDRVDPNLTGYFANPTPGAANSTSGPGFAPTPVFSVPGGVFTQNSVSVTLSAAAGEIHYTTDGTAPTLASARYSSAINIDVSTVVQARVFQTGLLPSEIVIQTYNLLGSGLANFNSNLPLLIINTAGQGIGAEQRVRAFISAFETHDARARLSNPPDFESAAQIETRGQTSAGFPKTPYNLETDDPYGNDVEVSLLGLPAESDWVLHNPFSDKCLMNNFLAFELFRKMGHYAPRCRFVEVFVKTSRGRLNYPEDYQGVYVLMEKIKVDGNRVDIARLTPQQNQEPEISGGYIIKKDKDSPGDLGFSTQGGGGFSGQYLKFHEPKPREITTAQQNWIRNYLNQFERSLYAADWLSRTGTNHYSYYIDVDSFVDEHWIVEFTKQIDGYRLSNYMSKDRGGKLKIEPIWDWNLAFGNADYLDGWNAEGWYYSLIGEGEHLWLRRLISGTTSGDSQAGDPDFNQKIVDRWSVLRTNILGAPNVLARIDQIASYLNEAQARDFAKFPRLDSYVWPNPFFYIQSSYGEIITEMKRWMQERFDWIDRQFVAAPVLSHGGGMVPSNFAVTLRASGGSILFTTDGTDPRAPGGGVNPGARTYGAQAIAISQNARVVARARNNGRWSGPAAATYIVQTPPLVITEIMYHPAAPVPGSGFDAEDFEFIELKNIGTGPLNLAGFHFTRGINFVFSATDGVASLTAGAPVLLVKNRAAFASRYPAAVDRVAGEYAGSLDNAGERVTLEGPLLEPILDFTYDNRWLPITDGHGYSLEIANALAPLGTWGFAESWRPSGQAGGSPGKDSTAPATIPRVVINEALTHTDPPELDAIELYNPTEAMVDIGGWYLTDDFITPQKFRLPSPSLIPPGGFLVVDESAFRAAAGFSLSALGDELYLFSASPDLTGYVHGFRFGAAANGVSFGRHLSSGGVEHFVSQTQATLGRANAGPEVGPIVINEILFEPPPIGTTNNPADEFIELANVTGQPAPLFDPAFPTNSWRLQGGATFHFPTNAVLPAGAFALVVNFDPANPAVLASFRQKYAVDSSVLVYGPYGGNLENNGERLALSRPDPPQVAPAPNPGTVPYIVVDEIRYSPDFPWPTGAAGTGKSLQRAMPAEFGDDPANWFVGAPSAGKSNTNAAADTDQDGLADAWESLHFGNLNAAPNEDPDQDGLSNLQEQIAGTDPLNSGSHLALAAIPANGGTVRLSFYAVPGRAYQLFSRGANGGAWQPVQTVSPPPSGRVALDLTPSSATQFYRVAIP